MRLLRAEALGSDADVGRTSVVAPLSSLLSELKTASIGSAEGVLVCETMDGLAAITGKDRELVVWQREIPLRLQEWLEGMNPARLPDLRILLRPDDMKAAMEPLLDNCGMLRGDLRDLLVQDIVSLVAVFAGITRSDLVDVRLERINHDACRRYHRDCVEARLLTTYLGPATQWIRPHHARQALREQTEFNGPIEQLGTHDVAIFKGSCAGPGSGIVHRSPPIAGSGVTRLMLCLNTPSEASPDLWLDTASP